jgi:acetyl-CoA C-acetyltransferase
MAEAYIYDHVRTPRGRGKATGALHQIPPIELAAQVLAALRDRSAVDTALVDDVVLGVVTPVGEQGCDIARPAALIAGYAESVPGMQIDRFCSSGLDAVNTAAAQVMSGQAGWWSAAASNRCRACRWDRRAGPGPATRPWCTARTLLPRASAPT